jgi:NitT/TauT family transport system permease protein
VAKWQGRCAKQRRIEANHAVKRNSTDKPTQNGFTSSTALRWILHRAVPPLIAAALFVGGWSAAVQFWQIPSYLVPSPSAVGERLIADRQLLITAWWLTGQAALSGLCMSLLMGTVVAVAFSQSAWLRYALYPYAIFLQTVPIVAIAPLLVMWLGYGRQGVIAVAFVLSVFPMIANVTAGMLAVPEPLRELFMLYGATRWQYLTKLQFPTAVPYLVTGLKTSSGLSVIGAIVGEFFVGYGDTGYGLGYLIRNAADSLLSEWAMRRFGG